MQSHHQNLNDNPNNPLQLKSEQVAETPNTFSKYCPNVWVARILQSLSPMLQSAVAAGSR